MGQAWGNAKLSYLSNVLKLLFEATEDSSTLFHKPIPSILEKEEDAHDMSILPFIYFKRNLFMPLFLPASCCP